MKAHFVTFYSPGTFVAEETTRPIEKWDVDIAVEMSKTVLERYEARPYGFQFITKERGVKNLDSKITKTSNFYWLGGEVKTLDQVKSETPDEHVLISNMEIGGYNRVVVNTNSWKWTQPLRDGDIVLDV